LKANPPALGCVQRHFPEHEHILEIMYSKNESFLSLCEDFRDCLWAMEYWCEAPSSLKDATRYCEEYTALLEDMNKEIAAWLTESSEED
jgi:hypothetical protein